MCEDCQANFSLRLMNVDHREPSAEGGGWTDLQAPDPVLQLQCSTEIGTHKQLLAKPRQDRIIQ